MRILLLGKIGQLGWELRRTLAPLGEITALDYPEIDLTRVDEIRRVVLEANPQVVINATAYTAVDRAESEPEVALAVNGRAPGIMAEASKELGAAFIHYSTDYVFDGTKSSPYVESDPTHPLGMYGESKLAGEQAIQQAGENFLIFRTSWVYSTRRDSFVTKVLQWSRQQPMLRMVTDQISSPTWARLLAEITAQVLAKGGDDPRVWLKERRGLYHLAGSGYASRMEWGQAILRLDPHREQQLTREVVPALTADFPTPAQRPLYSALACDHFNEAFGLRLPDWEDALALAMQDL